MHLDLALASANEEVKGDRRFFGIIASSNLGLVSRRRCSKLLALGPFTALPSSKLRR